MSIINKGTSFANGEQLTADKINDLIDLATFNQNATDSQTTDVNSAGQIVVNQGGIDTAQLATDAVETAKIKDANVTFAKLADVIDDDTMATATNTTLATSESIKAYVDGKGITQTTGTAPYYGCRAFGSFNGTDATPITPESSGNVSSIVRNAAGDYTITLTEALPTNCSVVASAGHNVSVAYGNSVDVFTTSTTEIRIIVARLTAGPYNPVRVSFAAFG